MATMLRESVCHRSGWPPATGRNSLVRRLRLGGGTLFPDRVSYVLADVSLVAARRAAAASIPAVLADGAVLPFASSAFDTVACHDVLEHVIDPHAFIAEMCRVASRRVVIAGPNWVGPYAGGLDRHLPQRWWSYVIGHGKGWTVIEDPYLEFDGAWHPDDDALCTVNSGWVAEELRRGGLRITQLRSWEHAFGWLNAFPGLRCLGQYMLVVGVKN